jgi:uncharacterized tellurite resistance protein B-like protein
VEQHFNLQAAESLQLLTRALTDIAENPDLVNLIRKLATILSEQDKEDVALMMLKVIAADGTKEAEEMERLSNARDVLGISPGTMHLAYTRYFDEST